MGKYWAAHLKEMKSVANGISALNAVLEDGPAKATAAPPMAPTRATRSLTGD